MNRTRKTCHAAILVASTIAAFGFSPAGAQDATGQLQWTSWVRGDGGAVDQVLSQYVDAAPRDFIVADFDGDGVGEIVARRSPCDPSSSCDYDILRYVQGAGWDLDMSLSAARFSIAPVQRQGVQMQAIVMDGIPWVFTESGIVPGLDPVDASIEGRGPYSDEIDLLANLIDPGFGIPKDQLWMNVYEGDLTADGVPERIFSVMTSSLCMQATFCPFYVVDQNGVLMTEGYTSDTPYLVARSDDDVYDLIATVPSGFAFHQVAGQIRQ